MLLGAHQRHAGSFCIQGAAGKRLHALQSMTQQMYGGWYILFSSSYLLHCCYGSYVGC